MLDSIVIFLETNGLWALFFFMITNGIISTPPSEIVLFLGGVYANTFQINFFSVLIVAVLGNLIGAYILFTIGRFFGYEWIFKSKYLSKLVNEKRMHILADKFRKDGAHWVVIFKCIPGTRTLVSIPAGMIKMPTSIFLLYTFLGATIWSAFWIILGYYIGMSFLEYKIFITVILFIILFITLFVFRKIANNYLEETIK